MSQPDNGYAYKPTPNIGNLKNNSSSFLFFSFGQIGNYDGLLLYSLIFVEDMLTRFISYSFSLSRKIPIVNIASFLQSEQLDDQCKTLLSALEETGCALIRDPRVDTSKNDKFLDELEAYFTKRQSQIDRNQPVDSYPELHYQVGISPPHIVQLQTHSDFGQEFAQQHKPFTKYPQKTMSKMRYLWTIGQPGPHIAANRPPTDFPNFASVMDDWGNKNFSTVITVSQMLAMAMKIPKNSFKDILEGGANKLAPNANDLRRCQLWEPFTSLHYDFSFLTIHGQSRFPGLYIWLRNGQKMAVSIPNGHLLIQAGSELEYLTAGLIHRGFHEAINTPQVVALASKAVAEGKIPWRITSTVFTHLRHDVVVRPLPIFTSPLNEQKYPPVLQYDYFMKELALNRT